VAGVKRRRLDEYDLVQQLQLQARLGWLRDVLGKTGYTHDAMDADPETVEWLDASRTRFDYPSGFYIYNQDKRTAGEIRHGWMWRYNAEGAVEWVCRHNGMPPLVAALERGPSAAPEQN